MATTHPWITHYPKGVSPQINTLSFQNMIELFSHASEKFAERTAYENMGVKLSYRVTDRLATAFAAYLQK